MNILFSSDDNYARHLGVAMVSIMLRNKDAEKIHFFVINNRITLANLEKLESVVGRYDNAEISFIPFDAFVKQLHLNLSWPISLSSYARLFVGEMLPTDLDKVLYLDCDVVVNDSIEDLWETDLCGNILGAVQDTIPSKTKASVGLLSQQPYFNAGVLLIDLNRWRDHAIGHKCLAFIESHEGCVTHHDQGVLNGVLVGQWKRLSLKYNVMSIHYMMTQSKIKDYYKDAADFYDAYEIEVAIKKPTILHFTPSFTTHPWEKHCCHPLRDCYKQDLDDTPWRNYPLDKDKNPWYVRLLNFRYRFLPF